VVLLFLLFAWLFGAFDATNGSSADSGSHHSGSGSASGSGSGEPSSPTSSADAQAKAQAMETFVSNYVAAAIDDPHSSWPLLTPGFQAQSGSFGQYQKFWDQWDSADITRISAQPRLNTVRYQIVYTRAGGGHGSDGSVTNDVTLTLEPHGDGFLIADEA
jgi:hypothetical protein